MSHSRFACWCAAIVEALLSPLWATAADPQRTLEKDPIELVAGRSVDGKPELSVFHDGITYRFATEANKAAFEAAPAKYEVADGGACGRMGPLSGLGDARRHAVHDGRIFFFASDGCREGFLKDPAAHIERDDEMPFGSHEQVVQGRATLDKFVAWAGGAERLREITSFRAWSARTEKQGEKDWRVTRETVVAFPRSYYSREAWNESWFSTTSTPEGGAMASTSKFERIAPSRARAFDRSMARWPIVILKAYTDSSPKADCPGLVAIGDGEGDAAGMPVEFVKVWLNGAASRLAISKADGSPISISYTGRDGSMRVGAVVRKFTASKSASGLTLPTAYTVTLGGKELPRAAETLDGFETEIPSAPDRFRIPAWDDTH